MSDKDPQDMVNKGFDKAFGYPHEQIKKQNEAIASYTKLLDQCEKLLDDLNIGHKNCDEYCSHRFDYIEAVEQFAAQIAAQARVDALKEAAEHCLCTRNTYGFDYHEEHKKLGKPAVGARWLTPTDIAKNASNALKTPACGCKIEFGGTEMVRCPHGNEIKPRQRK